MEKISINVNDKVSEKFKGKVVICSDYKYSNTTSKYRCAFLDEKIKDTDKKIEIGQYVELTEGKKILLGKNDGDRLIIVQLVNN